MSETYEERIALKLRQKIVTVRPGDKCVDSDCNGNFLITLTCSDDACGNTIHPADEDFRIEIPGRLNQIQIDLLSSFLVGHWREILKSEHEVAFERILETLNPGALKAVRNLQKGYMGG